MNVFPGNDVPLYFPFPVHWFTDKDVTLIEVEVPSIGNIDIVVNAVIKYPNTKSVFIYSPAEVSEYNYLDAIHAILPKIYNVDNIAICDAGIPLCRGNLIHIPVSWLGHSIELDDLPDTLPENRLYKFCCFNAIPRPHRIKLVIEIIRNDLLEHGQVSCGWAQQYNDWSRYVPEDLLHHFPMIVDLPHKHDGDYWSTAVMNVVPAMAKSIINVISESSMDQYTYQYSCWSRGMITEKTMKVYAACQLPIWHAVKGFVQYQRELGFDVFDDIIDHSYDNVENPLDRIPLIVKELKKLTDQPLSALQDLLKVNWHRLQYNKNQTSIAADHIKQTSGAKVMDWLDSTVSDMPKETPHPRLKGLKIKV
jgi:hypothetical protein